MAEKVKLVEVKLPFAVTLNGVAYDGKVKVEEDIATGIKEVVDGVEAEKAENVRLQEEAQGKAE